MHREMPEQERLVGVGCSLWYDTRVVYVVLIVYQGTILFLA